MLIKLEILYLGQPGVFKIYVFFKIILVSVLCVHVKISKMCKMAVLRKKDERNKIKIRQMLIFVLFKKKVLKTNIKDSEDDNKRKAFVETPCSEILTHLFPGVFIRSFVLFFLGQTTLEIVDLFYVLVPFKFSINCLTIHELFHSFQLLIGGSKLFKVQFIYKEEDEMIVCLIIFFSNIYIF